jgi:hypothetical protein
MNDQWIAIRARNMDAHQMLTNLLRQYVGSEIVQIDIEPELEVSEDGEVKLLV